MGNAMGGGRRRKRTQVMKIDGETFQLNTPTRASEVMKEHPDHVLLESESVKHYGHAAKPLEPHHHLQPTKLYFLLHLPEQRRMQSSVHLAGGSAMDRLERLKVYQRSISDLQIARQDSDVESGGSPVGGESESLRVKVRLPRDQVEKLVKESKDREEVAEKIVNLYVRDGVGGGDGRPEPRKAVARSVAREKRVSFVH